MAYQDWIPKTLVPPWMRLTWWTKYWTAIGQAFDLFVATVKWAVKARFPSVTNAATDSLDAIGGERSLPRGNTSTGAESDASFAGRLANAWTIWAYGGTAYGLLTALATAGYPTARVMITNGIEYTLSDGNLVITSIPQGSWWSWMSRATKFWSEFQIVFGVADLPTPTTGALSDWTSALPSSTSDEMNMLRALIQRWRPAFGRCAGIVAVTAVACFGYPFEDWQTTGGDNWGGDAVTLFTVD